MRKLAICLLLSAALSASAQWSGDTFTPGEPIAFDYHHGKLPAGTVRVVLDDVSGREFSVPGIITRNGRGEVLTLICPSLPSGYYEIAEVKARSRVQLGRIDGTAGFYIERGKP